MCFTSSSFIIAAKPTSQRGAIVVTARAPWHGNALILGELNNIGSACWPRAIVLTSNRSERFSTSIDMASMPLSSLGRRRSSKSELSNQTDITCLASAARRLACVSDIIPTNYHLFRCPADPIVSSVSLFDAPQARRPHVTQRGAAKCPEGRTSTAHHALNIRYGSRGTSFARLRKRP
jgi:hypothetical protein